MKVHEVSTDDVCYGTQKDKAALMYDMELGHEAHVLEPDGTVRIYKGHRFAVPLMKNVPEAPMEQFTDKALVSSPGEEPSIVSEALIGLTGYWAVKDETGATVSPLE